MVMFHSYVTVDWRVVDQMEQWHLEFHHFFLVGETLNIGDNASNHEIEVENSE